MAKHPPSGPPHTTDPTPSLGATPGALVLEVGRRIRFLRSKRISGRMPQHRVAAQAGITSSFLSMVERGKRSVSLATLDAVAAALGVSLSDLFDRGADEIAFDRSTQKLVEYVRSRKLQLEQVEQLLAVARAMFLGKGPGKDP